MPMFPRSGHVGDNGVQYPQNGSEEKRPLLYLQIPRGDGPQRTQKGTGENMHAIYDK